MAEQRPKKKVVRVESTSAAPNASGGITPDDGPVWTPTPEAKSQATRLRVFAWILWALAIAGEAFTIFWVLKQVPPIMWLLIVMIVVIGILAISGSLLWKKANRLDPASRRDPVKFFIQNQLGVIMSIIAFLPLIVLIFTNKDMSGKQKALAGIIGIVVALAVGAGSATYDSPSQEQYAAEEGIVQAITGTDEVYWTKSGSVYHLCDAASDVNQTSADNQIYTGTAADARAAGKTRLTLELPTELRECGYEGFELPANYKAVIKGEEPFVAADWTGGTGATDESPATEPEPAATE